MCYKAKVKVLTEEGENEKRPGEGEQRWWLEQLLREAL